MLSQADSKNGAFNTVREETKKDVENIDVDTIITDIEVKVKPKTDVLSVNDEEFGMDSGVEKFRPHTIEAKGSSTTMSKEIKKFTFYFGKAPSHLDPQTKRMDATFSDNSMRVT